MKTLNFSTDTSGLIRMKTLCFSVCVLLFLLLQSCAPKIQITGNTYNKYQMKGDMPVDSVTLKTIQPYRDSLNRKMSVVIAESNVELVKQQPEGTLGNFVADALLEMGITLAHHPIDFSIVNNGGIRIPSLEKGNITVGRVYELMPFDNRVVVLNAKGSIVQQMMNVVAADKGWPVSGMTYSIHEMSATDIFIRNQPLDTGKIYSFILSDYIANGGDNCSMLKGLPQEQLNIMFRDLLTEYLKELTLSGKKIELPVTGRITVK